MIRTTSPIRVRTHQYGTIEIARIARSHGNGTHRRTSYTRGPNVFSTTHGQTIAAALAAILIGLCTASQANEPCPDVLPPLPPEIAEAKDDIIRLSLENLDRWGDRRIQSEIDQRASVLAEWFADNRPANELELTTAPWKAVWYEDTSFIPDILNVVTTDRENTYQVVRDGFYYNIAKIDLRSGRSITNFLKGEFTIKDPADSNTCGEPRRNVIDLEFTASSLRLGWLPESVPLNVIVELVDAGVIPAISLPFPPGSTGDLWNLYVDEDLRVAFGTDDSPSTDDGGLFVLVRQGLVTD